MMKKGLTACCYPLKLIEAIANKSDSIWRYHIKIVSVIILTIIMVLFSSVGLCEQSKVTVTLEKISIWSKPFFKGEETLTLHRDDEVVVQATCEE